MTPWQIYELSGGLTEEGDALRLIGHLDTVILNTNRRLTIRAWALAGSLLMIIVIPLTATLAGIWELDSILMSEQTIPEPASATNVSTTGVEQSQEQPRLPTGPLPSFGDDLPSFEIPGVIPSAKAILRALRLR